MRIKRIIIGILIILLWLSCSGSLFIEKEHSTITIENVDNMFHTHFRDEAFSLIEYYDSNIFSPIGKSFRLEGFLKDQDKSIDVRIFISSKTVKYDSLHKNFRIFKTSELFYEGIPFTIKQYGVILEQPDKYQPAILVEFLSGYGYFQFFFWLKEDRYSLDQELTEKHKELIIREIFRMVEFDPVIYDSLK